jgi:hypothetical protein
VGVSLLQVKRRIEEKNKLLRAMAAGIGREAAFAVVDLTEVGLARKGEDGACASTCVVAGVCR